MEQIKRDVEFIHYQAIGQRIEPLIEIIIMSNIGINIKNGVPFALPEVITLNHELANPAWN